MIAHRPRRRPGLVIATLALILLGSLFPRGYMPARGDGRIMVTLCTANGEQSVAIDIGKDDTPDRYVGSPHCWGIFTGLNGLGLLPSAAPLLAPPLEWPAVQPQALPRLPIVRLFHFDPNAPPQAPPVSAS